MSQVQSLARGHTQVTRYGRLGGHTGTQKAPPDRIKAFIFSLPGEGKSAFIQSCPDAYIFNLDLTSSTAKDMQATMFPGIDPATGNPVGDNGPVIITHDLIEEKLKVLKDLAVNNEPRPKIVCFDSLTAWVRLLHDYVGKHAKRLGLVASTAPDRVYEWRELNGKAAYDELYSIIVHTLSDLSAWGYGVYLMGHIVNSKMPLGVDAFEMKPELVIGAGLWKRIYDMFELSALIVTETGSETYMAPVTSSLRGVSSTMMKEQTRSVRRHYLCKIKTGLDGVCKVRVNLPDRIQLPEQGAWAHFDKIYREALAAS